MPITIQEKQNAHNFLKNHKVGVLATVDPNGNPHAAAIYYIFNGSDVLFMTKTGTRKADNLRRNNHAMFVIYEAESQSTVQITGKVSEITELKEANGTFFEIMKVSLNTSDGNLPPISKLQVGNYIAYRLTPKEIRMAVFSRSKLGNYEDIFKTTNPK